MGTGNSNLTNKQQQLLQAIETIIGPIEHSKIMRTEQRSSTLLLAQDISFVQLNRNYSSYFLIIITYIFLPILNVIIQTKKSQAIF